MTQKASYWNSVAKKWQEASPNSLWRAYNDAVNATWLEQCLPNGKVNHLLKTDLFDESLDDGLYPLLKSKANKVVGVDISTLTSHAAKSRHTGLEVIAADVRQLPFADGVFDIIVSNSTLDHFESSDEILSSLRELHRVLQPGGQLLITLDNLLNPVIALRAMLPFRLLNRLNIVPYYVGATFSPRRLCNYLELIGFNVTKVNAIMHFPRALTMAIALILQKQSGGRLQRHLLNFLMIFERLEYLPTKFLTGYFVAVRAIKR